MGSLWGKYLGDSTPDGPGDPSGLSFLISDSSSLAEMGSVKMEGVEWEVEEVTVIVN